VGSTPNRLHEGDHAFKMTVWWLKHWRNTSPK